MTFTPDDGDKNKTLVTYIKSILYLSIADKSNQSRIEKYIVLQLVPTRH